MKSEPTIRQLRHFLSLAQHCHFSRAADACLITQSSLSASIRELESVLECQLFERTKRTVLLTPLGRDLMGLAQGIVAGLDDLTEHAKSDGLPLTGKLIMGVIPTIGPFLLPRVLPGLRKSHPDLKLYLREDKSGYLLRQLSEGSLDLALIALPHNTDGFETFAFADDPFLAVFPRGHDLANFETMTPTRLKKADLLTLEGGNCLTDQTLAMGKIRTEDATNMFQASSLHTLVQMVDNGLGLTVLPKMAVDTGILRGLKLDFRPFSSPRASRHIALAWRRSSRRTDDFRLLGEHLRDELATPLR